jgi:hypothetical protein
LGSVSVSASYESRGKDTDIAARSVSTLEDLLAAVGDQAIRRITVEGEIAGAPSLWLAPGQQLVGVGDGAAVLFAHGVEGVRLSRDNELSHIRLQVEPELRAIFNDTAVDGLGTVRLVDVTTVGQVQILATERVRAGHVEIDGLDVVSADVRGRTNRPHNLGVDVLQGAFTLWVLQPEEDVTLTAQLRGISAGREGAPVRGSGVLVGGAGESGGRLRVSVLETGPIFTDGGIPEGTRDMISGGVFVIYGAHARDVRNRGPVTTSGVNDMVLDNWGTVGTWTAEAPLTSFGPSGVGFVNFGTIAALRIKGPVETHGRGARGFNVYTGGAVETAEFERITTHADAAIGIQVSQPIGRLAVRDGIHTNGGAGDSLVKGQITRLSAHALSVQAGGGIADVDIGGGVTSAGTDVVTVDVQGEIGRMKVTGGIHARGDGSDALRVDGGVLGLHDTEVTAADGAAIRLIRATLTELRGVTANGPRGDVVVDQDSTLVTGGDSAGPGGGEGNRFTVTGPATLRTHRPDPGL